MTTRTSNPLLVAVFAPLALALVACAETPAGQETGEDTTPCREFASASDCAAAPDFTNDDGSAGRCAWFTGKVNTRNGDSCNEAADNTGVCLSVGPTQMSCTYTSMDQTYPSCAGIFGENDVPPYWVGLDDGGTLLIDNLCGPTIKDSDSGRCGRGEMQDASECECPCL